jgi:predicted DNA-binding transcriptional regulator AlpA
MTEDKMTMNEVREEEIKGIDDRFVRARTIRKILDISRAQVYLLLKKDPEFPRPMKISTKIMVWSLKEINDWMVKKKVNSA